MNVMMKLAVGAAAAMVLGAAGAASAATYLPFGPQTNVALSTVTGGGWSLCYSAPMSTFLGADAQAAASAAGCNGDRIMLAGRETGSQTLLALAQAEFADVFFDTGANNSVTHLANGTEWYNANEFSWGFAPGGQSVAKNQCDTNNGSGRICLHTVSSFGGYRINNIQGLNGSNAYEKLIFTTNNVAVVPEPGAWALMIVGFGAAGAALRRRREHRIYRLVELCDGGEKTEELFPAPDDSTAIARARQVAQRFELWREDQRLAG